MTSTANFQHSLHLQMSGSKKEEEEDFEAKNQPEYAQQQEENGTNIAKLSSIPSTSNGRYGRIVKVEGGHVVRSIPRKDRHSKVCTSKGPRDRRFRLSAQTAIDFYDLQDRLGYDRPSKAIEWLMHKSKHAIEALGHSSSTAHQFQHHQECNFMPAGTVQNRQQHLNESTVNTVGKEPVFGCVGEEALKSAFNLSEANFMEMGWFQNFMAWNHNAGDGGEGCSFNTS